ncbi:formate dehydrogenase accessory protein FdhE [Pseudodesulfovibrio sp.]|uniref:formate dehydrogenase accessory protein FdhE n=1 Tax=Pseudodesulfovibrio sp. TaxID=2035812 RepID=UPI002622DD76|nr:formate dehydrogenase accessory protein FdhE [Pseudodesulfovibrio sp.]MDD3312208.1 formate dehydrogenase accessory protein FdhE [Pseudodesulfovibrio sp.]
MRTQSALARVNDTLTLLTERTPAYRELTERFGPLLRAVAQMADELADTMPKLPAPDPSRLAAGVSLLVDADLAPCGEALKRSAAALLPVLADALRLNGETADRIAAHFAASDNLVGLAQARIEGNAKRFENTSAELGVQPAATLLFLSETIFAPVLRAIISGLDKPLTDSDWDQAYCPVCGSSPSISYLSPKEVTGLDQLVGGGGKKYLHCSLCGQNWRYKRNACAACGNDENQSREVFTSDKTRFERVEACHKCGHYCLSIDLRECEPHPDLDAIQVGLIHLDIFARKSGLVPVTATLWNSAE